MRHRDCKSGQVVGMNIYAMFFCRCTNLQGPVSGGAEFVNKHGFGSRARPYMMQICDFIVFHDSMAENYADCGRTKKDFRFRGLKRLKDWFRSRVIHPQNNGDNMASLKRSRRWLESTSFKIPDAWRFIVINLEFTRLPPEESRKALSEVKLLFPVRESCQVGKRFALL